MTNRALLQNTEYDQNEVSSLQNSNKFKIEKSKFQKQINKNINSKDPESDDPAIVKALQKFILKEHNG